MTRINKSQNIKMSIIEILSRLQTPLTADDIYMKVREKQIKTSISTIYAHLHRLVQSHILSVDRNFRACRYYYNQLSI